MLHNVLKKFLLILLVVVVYQHWGKIEHFFNPPPATARHSQSNARVVLYSTEWCGYCKLTRRFLDQQGIAFSEVDIEKDVEGRKTYVALGGGGIPMLDVNGTFIRGYNPEAILEALK
ncbi:glutaredoxin family protein [Pseudomonas akapageensis]|uniref:glutaredoxin family protein n=1 Tax=Pseudomonas akapageensis TaxID=2609961 RepID=UPI00140B620D|nr:glutaredoxin family protein [Pseudomonas akapageensis]